MLKLHSRLTLWLFLSLSFNMKNRSSLDGFPKANFTHNRRRTIFVL